MWRAVVLFPSPAFDPGVHPHYEEFFGSGRLRRLYLTTIPEEQLNKFPLCLFRIIIDPEEQVVATAEKIIRQMPEQVSDAHSQEIIIELLGNLLLSKLPQMSRKEIEKMFEPLLSDVRKSRFYQEVAEEVTQESKYGIARTMLKKNFSLELIAEITGLSEQEIDTLSRQTADYKN